MGGGKDLRGWGGDTWIEGEINLAGSGLSEVVIIAGGEMMIALIWECLLWAAKACSCAHVHARTDGRTHSHKHRQVGAFEYYKELKKKVTRTHSHKHMNT